MTASFSFTTAQLSELFPFHLLLDESLNIASVGRSLQKVDPDVQPGQPWLSHFRVAQPTAQVRSLSDLLALQRTPVRLDPVLGRLSLRVQIIEVPGGAALLGSPWLQDPEEVSDLHLSLRDFASHDSTAELLFMMQGKSTALSDAKSLTLKLRKQSEELKVAMREAKFANLTKSHFLANVSHEFRAPMTAILAYADLVFEQLDDDHTREFLDVIRQQSRHLLDMMNDVLDLSKIESGKFSVQRDVVQLFDLVTELQHQFQPAFQRKGIQLRVICDNGVPAEIFTNRVRFRQILMVLLSNSLKFTNHGSVTVVFEHQEQSRTSSLRVRVQDTGIGINPAQEAHLFRPFAQTGDSAKPIGSGTMRSGTGLGLTIAKRLANMLGGDVSYQRPSGPGSIFVVEIDSRRPEGRQPHDTAPVARNALPDPRQKSGRPNRPTASDGQTDGPGKKCSVMYPKWKCRILLVEDAIINQTLIKRLLELAGGTTLVASHGREAVEMLLGNDPVSVDLVLMDLRMPIMDGFEATRQLRTAGVRLPIVALTANTAEMDREACLEAGCDDFLGKPIDRMLLYKTIQLQLDRVDENSPLRDASGHGAADGSEHSLRSI